MSRRASSTTTATVPCSDDDVGKITAAKKTRNDNAVCNSTGLWTLLFVVTVTTFLIYLTPPPSGHPRIESPVPDVLFRPEQMEDKSEGLLDLDLLRKNMPPELNVISGNPKKKIAWAVTVSKDGAFVDGAAVLMRSVQLAHSASPSSQAGSGSYEHEFVAICHPEATRSRDALKALGWVIVERVEPVLVEAIQGEFLRKHILKSGCCGARELLKLYAWTLTSYWRVVHLDMDSLVLGNLDELFALDASMVYTCDYNMMSQGSREKLHQQRQQQQQRERQAGEGGREAHGKALLPLAMDHKKPRACPVQGGFVVVRPSLAVFDAMVAVVAKGDFTASGWGGTSIGGWWGGATFQGVVPYYYEVAELNGSLPDGRAVEVDRCVYNNMVDKGVVTPPPSVGQQECRATPLDTIKNVHFTVCQKPWDCNPAHQKNDLNGLCLCLHKRWHGIRHSLEQKLTSPFPSPATGLVDSPAQLRLRGSGSEGGGERDWTLGHCRNGPGGKYVPMNLPSAPSNPDAAHAVPPRVLLADCSRSRQGSSGNGGGGGVNGSSCGDHGGGGGGGVGEDSFRAQADGEEGGGGGGEGAMETRTTPHHRQQRQQSQQRRVIAWAITVSADGPFVDGAAVLLESIRQTHPALSQQPSSSHYEHEFVAFVHPNATRSVAPLSALGFQVKVLPLPVRAEEIQTAFLRKHAAKSGCCGLAELLKLYAWTLTSYWRVVHLDMDSLVLGNLDELFALDTSLVYTCDYNMMNKQTRANNPGAVCPVQGGFVVVKPDVRAFEHMVEIVREGRFGAGVRNGASGWNGTGIGHWWGGATFQGIVPFYYYRVADPTVFPAVEVDRCVYDNMVDDPVKKPRVGASACRATSLDEIKNVHFTLCQKPWKCSFPQFPDDTQGLCAKLHTRWFELRGATETRLGILPPPEAVADPKRASRYHGGACKQGRYIPMSLPAM